MPVVKTWDVRDARRKMGLSQSQMAAQLGVSVESYRTCDSRQQMEKQDGQIAHGPIVTSWRIPGNTKEIGIRHAQALGWSLLNLLTALFEQQPIVDTTIAAAVYFTSSFAAI